MKWIKQFEQFEEPEIDIDLIESALLDIKDEFDLNKISYEEFLNYIIESQKPMALKSLYSSNFNNSYMVSKIDKSVQITILVKEKDSNHLHKNIKNFIHIIESSGDLKSYKNSVLRKGSDFKFYHVCISLYSRSCYIN
jgi:hypothetical protein